MAINPTLPPTVAEFRALFPEFADTSDERVQYNLDIGMTWIDSFWFSPDDKIVVLHTAAHYLYIQTIAGGTAVSGGSEEGGGGGGVVDPELGKIWIKSIRFRDRHIVYDRVGVQQQAGGGSSSKAASDEFWKASPYGQIVLSYRRRNVPHIAVI